MHDSPPPFLRPVAQDRLLELGFKTEVEEVVRACPRSRQTMLFSATISEEVAKLANLSLNKPLQIKVDPIFNVASTLQQEFVRLRANKEHEREALLLSLCTRTYRQRVIVFLSSKWHAHRIKILFGLAGLNAAELHGNLTQQQRLQALADFRDGKADFLLATDLAGRGLDIRGVRVVINFELPSELKSYTHRVGRTARAGSGGRAVSIVAERDRAFLKQVIKHAADVVKTRTVPPESVSYWVDRIAALEPQVAEVLQEEGEEKAIRVAEMEANKANNLLEHAEEIKSRPARSWFQTEKEKKEIREQSARSDPTTMFVGKTLREAEEAAAKAEAKAAAKKKVKRDPYAGMPRKQRRARQREELLQAAVEEEGSTFKLPNQKAAARSAKAEARRAPGGMASVLGKRANAGSKDGGAKKQKAAPSSSAGEPRKPGKKDTHGKPRKVRSKSKPKFAKARKR